MPHQYGYSQDIICTGRIDQNWNGLNKLLNEADIIHIKDERGFFDGSNEIPKHLFDKLKGKTPIIYTGYGGLLRRFQNDKIFLKYITRMNKGNKIVVKILYKKNIKIYFNCFW